MKIVRTNQQRIRNNYLLKAQHKDKGIKTYGADNKTDCMYQFDRYNLRRGFKFFMVIIKDNIVNVEPLSRDYPYQQHILE